MVVAGAERTGRQSILSRHTGFRRIADWTAVDEGLIDVLDAAQQQCRAASRLRIAEHDRRAVPDHAVEAFESDAGPVLPCRERRHGPPRVIGRRVPGFAARGIAAAGSPPGFPQAAPAGIGLFFARAIVREQPEQFVLAAKCAQRFLVHPARNRGAAPGRIDEPHRHFDGAAQFAREEVADCGELRRRGRRGDLPRNRPLECSERHETRVVRYGEHSNRRVGRALDLGA